VLGGGRYDGLIENLGGSSTPAVGWAAGIERLAMLVDMPVAKQVDVAVIPMGGAAEAVAIGIVANLRRAGVVTDMTYRGNMKKRMQRANAQGAKTAIIIGDDELAQGEVTIRNLVDGTQERCKIDALGDYPLASNVSFIEGLLRGFDPLGAAVE
jgi:histidyl-tRNA synthetase